MPKKVICKNVLGEESEVAVEQLFFRPSVYGILIENNKILLSKQWDGYDFPGGGIELGETTPEALKREFLEETGFNIELKDFVTFKQDFFEFRFKDQHSHSFLFYYTCTKIGGNLSEQRLTEEEKQYCGEAEWINLKDIEKIKFYNTVDSVGIIKKSLEINK